MKVDYYMHLANIYMRFRSVVHYAFSNHVFVRNFSKLILGTAGAQVIGIITVPILTRLYSVADYGIQGIYQAILGLIVIIAAGRYETAILLPKEHQEAFLLCVLSMILTAVFSIFYLVFIMLTDAFAVEFLGNTGILAWRWFLPITLISMVLSTLTSTWLNRMRDYTIMSRTGIMASIFNFIVAFIYAGIFPGDSRGLLLNTFVGSLFVSIFVLWYCHRHQYICWKWFSFRGLFQLAKKYDQFPKYLVPSSLLNVLSTRLPIFLLQGFGGSEVVGWFSMGVKLVGMPMQLITSAVGNVFMRDAAEEWQEEQNSWISFKRTFSVLVLLGIFPSILMFLFAPDLASLFLGDKWYMAGVYCAYLAPMYYIDFIFSPLSGVMIIASQQRLNLLCQIIRLSIIVLFMEVTFSFWGTPSSSIIAYGTGFVIYYSFALLLCAYLAKGKNFR